MMASDGLAKKPTHKGVKIVLDFLGLEDPRDEVSLVAGDWLRLGNEDLLELGDGERFPFPADERGRGVSLGKRQKQG